VIALADLLANNAHNVWARSRILQGWTYGHSKDEDSKRNPLLIPYDQLDDAGKGRLTPPRGCSVWDTRA
jgi:hypothetical protein